jgi:hypothetical protein
MKTRIAAARLVLLRKKVRVIEDLLTRITTPTAHALLMEVLECHRAQVKFLSNYVKKEGEK